MNLRKYWTILGVFIQDSMAYRSQIMLWMLTDIVPAIIMPFVWLAGMQGRSDIKGFGPGEIVLYYLTMTLLSNFIVSHVQWEMSRDIKDGFLSKFLLYPFSYLRYHYIGNIAYRLMRVILFAPFAVLWFIIFRDEMDLATLQTLYLGWEFWVALVLGHLVAFFCALALGNLAFYFVETTALFVAYYIVTAVFSGQIAPYALLPETLQSIASATPFRYTLSFPLEVMNGTVHGAEFRQGAALQVLWLFVLYLMSLVGWKFGTRQYAGAGM